MANTPPVATIANHTMISNRWAQVSLWLSYSDANGNPAQLFQFQDNDGSLASAYFWTPDTPQQPANIPFAVNASDIDTVWIKGGFVAGTDSMQVRAFDGTDWGAWHTFTLTTDANVAPVINTSHGTVVGNHWRQVSLYVTAVDPNLDPVVQYQFMDNSAGPNSDFFYTPDNPHQPANTWFTVNASDLGNVWVNGGLDGGDETFAVRGFDGWDWGSPPTTITLTITPDSAPVATITDHSVAVNHWRQVSNWLTYSDTESDPAVQYEFVDNGTGADSAYFYTPDNQHHAANQTFFVNASDIGNVWIKGGAVPGADTMQVRAFDGTYWGTFDTFVFNTVANTAPVATINDHSLPQNHWAQVSSWISYLDADGDPAVQYQFSDGGTGANSAYFYTPDNHHHAANQDFVVDAADINNVWVSGGAATGGDTMWVRAFDGIAWSAWDSFTLSTVVNTLPAATINDQNVPVDHWRQVSNWIHYSDADSDPAVQYRFLDNGFSPHSAYLWTPDGGRQPEAEYLTVNASDLDTVWIKAGDPTLPGISDQMWVQAFDGTDWSTIDGFTLNTVANTPPVATINDQSLARNHWGQVSNWLSYSDANGDPAVQYQFSDGGNGVDSAFFYTPDNTHHAANADFTVNGADVGNVWVRGGAATGTDTLWVRAYDGTAWSAWDQFTLTTTT